MAIYKSFNDKYFKMYIFFCKKQTNKYLIISKNYKYLQTLKLTFN